MSKATLDQINLVCADMDASIAFYRRLGVEFPPEAESRTDIQVPLGDGHQLVISTTLSQKTSLLVRSCGT